MRMTLGRQYKLKAGGGVLRVENCRVLPSGEPVFTGTIFWESGSVWEGRSFFEIIYWDSNGRYYHKDLYRPDATADLDVTLEPLEKNCEHKPIETDLRISYCAACDTPLVFQTASTPWSWVVDERRTKSVSAS